MPMIAEPTLEVVANSLASALAAQAGGATRVELCAALELGGLTPSHAQIRLVRERLSIPVHVLVRPRAGGFVYSAEEHETMLADIAYCVSSGCDGVVIGALNDAAEVDIARCRELAAAAGSLATTFHRAIDICEDMPAALETVISLGIDRILSSGGEVSAVEGAAMLRRLAAQAGERIAVMAGAGITSDNIAMLADATGLSEFHASAKRMQSSPMPCSRAQSLGMQGGEVRSDVDEVRRLVAALRRRRVSP